MRLLLDRLLRLSIGTKLSLSFVSIVLLTSIPISVLMILWLEDTLREYIGDTIKKEIASRENDIRNAMLNGDYWTVFKQVDALARLKGIKDVAVINNVGFIIAHSDPLAHSIGSYLSNYMGLERIPIESYNQIMGYIVFRIDNKAIESAIFPLKLISVGFTSLFLFFGVSMGFFVSMRISSRLRKTLRMMDRFEKGELDRVEFAEKDEINTFADYMYKSLLRINTMINNSLFERDFYQNLVNTLQDILLILGTDRKIYYTNGVINRLGFTYNDLLFRSVFVLIEDEKDRKRLRMRLQSGEAFTEGIKLRARNGKPYAVISFTPVEDAFIVSIKDITEFKKMEALYMLGELSAGLAHELKNALLPVKLLSDVSNWDEEDVKVVRSAINRIDHTINAVLSFANTGKHSEELVFSKELVDSWLYLYEPLIKSKGIRLNIRIENFGFFVNKHAFQVVFSNLLKNALEAVEESRGRVDILLRRSNGRVVLTVEDNGPGIPSEYKEKVFEPFFSTKGNKGTGLGLSLALKYTYEMGGYLQMETQDGKGTRFTVEVPLKDEKKGLISG
ncbi:MAG: ATP-binding protein [Aquificaceae bacterium]